MWDKIVFLVIVILVVVLGVIIIQITAPGFLLIAILIGLFLLLLGLTASALAWKQPGWPILLFLLAAILAVVPGLSGLHPLVAPCIIAASWIALLIAILVAKQNVNGYLLGDHWHLTKKGLGGTIFADIANMIGVFAGIGAYRLVSDDLQLVKAWWWIGQMAAYMAAAVGLSLIWRWGNTPAGGGEGKQKWPGLFNWIVAAGTIVSLYAPTESNRLITGLETGATNDIAGVAAGGIWLALLIFLVLVSWYILFIRRSRFFEDGKSRFVTIVFLLITIASILAVIFSIIGARSSQDWTIPGTIIGILAIFAWIGGEFYNYVGLTLEFKANQTYISVLDYLDWEKNFWEIVGGLGTILFLIGNNFFKETFGNTNDILFYVAATLGFLGTLRGVLRGILKQIYTDDFEQRAGFQEAQNANRGLIIQDHLARINQLQHTIGQKDILTQNLQQNLDQCNTNVLNLQQDVAQRVRDLNNREDQIGILQHYIRKLEGRE